MATKKPTKSARRKASPGKDTPRKTKEAPASKVTRQQPTTRKVTGKKLTARKKPTTRKVTARKVSSSKTPARKKTAGTKTAGKARKKTAGTKTVKKVAGKKPSKKTAGKASKTTVRKKADVRKPTKAARKAPRRGTSVRATKEPRGTSEREKKGRSTAWLDLYPQVAALRDAEVSRELGLRWLSKAEAQKGGRQAEAHYAEHWHLGILWSDELWEACREVTRGLLKVAEGPMFSRRQVAEAPCALYLHPDRPQELWLALSTELPALLWIPFPTTASSLQRTLGAFWPQRRIPRMSLPSERRVFLGYKQKLHVPSPYSGELEEAGPHELDRHWAFSPVVDPQIWGTSHDDDPWEEHQGSQAGPSVVQIAAQGRAFRQQERGAVSTLTQRTTFSRSHFGIEIHHRGIYVGVLRYRPNPFPEVVRRFNERCGSSFPTDLPLDLVAALHGFLFLSAEELSQQLDAQTSDPARVAYIEALAAVCHPDLSFTQRLRRWSTDPSEEIRGAVVNAAIQYNWMFLLEDMAAQPQPEPLAKFLAEALVEGIAEPSYNEMGEPDWMDGDEDDEDDEDGDEESDQ